MDMQRENAPEMGMNRTGMQMSPQDSQRLMENADTTTARMDLHEIELLRAEYIAQADPLGSVPLPGSAKGIVTTGAKKLTGKRPELLMDKLAERAAFERGGTRLYEALIGKLNSTDVDIDSVSVADLRDIRDEEAEHFHLVSEAIRELGGDPTAQTPGADLVGVEAQGLIQVVSDPRTTFTESLHAVLVAELTDVDAWAVLTKLAEMNGEDEIARRFRNAMAEEDEHLTKVRAWYQELTLGAAS